MAIACRRLRVTALAISAAVVAGCGSGGGSGQSGPGQGLLPPVPPTITVEMREYSFANPAEVPRGRVVLAAHNGGQVVHSFSLFALPEDFPPILDQIRGSERRAASPLAALATYPAGATGAVAVDLAPGRYAMVCFVVDPDNKNHASKGMASEFRAT